MKNLINLTAAALTVVALCACTPSTDKEKSVMEEDGLTGFKEWAVTPPMGWNSWDYYGTSITEEQAKAQADAMARYLLPAGYDVFTVDIQWYEPNAKGHFYNADATLSMDEFGRLVPATNRFPSAANGNGFKSLADYVHAQGLRFGIHIMRGIPKQAVSKDLPVKGTQVLASDVAVNTSICPWNPDMYGVDATTTEGQAYYDSIIQMYADWGVDFLKVDDISRPYDEVRQAEIEAIRKAIDKTGRKIVLSLSPGSTPLSKGPHVTEHANMWRISDDFWDRWGALREMFDFVHEWEPYRKSGNWPDADMLPIGKVEFGRDTNFSVDEQYTLMNLWSMARSPLIFGGDMSNLDDLTLNLLTNPEMLAVNQHSSNNRQLSREDNLIVWVADVPDSDDKYVALFNAQSKDDLVDIANADYASPVIAGQWKSQEIEVSVANGKQLVLFVNDANDGNTLDHVVWENPVLTGPEGELSLTDLDWSFASSGWGSPQVNLTNEGKPLLVEGKEVVGIGTHSISKIIYDLPEGYDTFTVRGVVSEASSVVFGVQVNKSGFEDVTESSLVSVNFADIGITGEAVVRDLWAHEDIGTFTNSFGKEIPLHGSGLYRISPVINK